MINNLHNINVYCLLSAFFLNLPFPLSYINEMYLFLLSFGNCYFVAVQFSNVIVCYSRYLDTQLLMTTKQPLFVI